MRNFLYSALLALPFVLQAEEEPGPKMTGEWGGARTYLREKGIELESTLILDNTWNLHGGREQSSKGVFESFFDVNATIESCPLLHYKGGTFFASFQSHHGQSPTEKEVGSLMLVDLQEAHGFNQIASLWYKQEFGNKFWLLFGKSDAYQNFTIVPHALYFLNSGYTAIPTILFFPTYPDPAMSIIGSLSFGEIISAKLGAFDGSLAEGVSTGHGIFGRFFKHPSAHTFFIGEIDFDWESGHIGVGGWRHTGKFETFEDNTKKGTGGPYFIIDQAVYKYCEEELALFFIFGTADPSISVAHYYFGAGTTWKGLLPSRLDDILGIGMSRANFTRNKHAEYSDSYEASYEIYYQYNFTDWGHLQPDFQYVVHPGGKGLPNASVLTLRLQFDI